MFTCLSFLLRSYWSRITLALSLPVFFVALFVALSGCQIENSDLRATTISPQIGPNCASCHAYPPRDTNHTYHLFEVDGTITNNRPITCLHCHNHSMIGRDTAFMDSIYRDPNGNEFHTLDFPDVDLIRTYPLLRVDSLVQNRPVAMPPRNDSTGRLLEWMTGLAHLNGKVDVDFNSTSIDTSRFGGSPAIYSPKELTCSAIACHPNPGEYRWAMPSRNLPVLKGEPPIAP
jgi:hypothetical protein